MKTHGVNIIHNIPLQTVFLSLLQKSMAALWHKLGYLVTAVVLGMAMPETHRSILLKLAIQ